MEIYSRFLVAVILVVILTRWLIRKSDPGFEWKHLVVALMAKIMAGAVYGYFFLHYYGGDDTWLINEDSMAELQKLLTRPVQFFEDVDIFRLVNTYGGAEGFRLFEEKLEWALMIKPLAIANLWSKGNYYINVVFFSGVSFWGGYWLFRLISNLRPGIRSWTYLVIFFYPPALFWLSGIRSDGLLFFFFSLAGWQFYKWMVVKNWKYLLAWMAGITGMLIIRPAFACLLLPAFLAWWLSTARGWNIRTAFFRVYAVLVIVFFSSSLLPVELNGPAIVAGRQARFFELQGKTRVSLDSLTANPVSFIKNLPAAIDNAFCRPYPWAAHGALQFGMVIQNIFLICLVLAAILTRYPGRKILTGEAFFAMLFFFSVSVYLSIGYTIPFPGALVRYRVIAETCLVLLGGIAVLGGRISNYNFFNVYKK